MTWSLMGGRSLDNYDRADNIVYDVIPDAAWEHPANMQKVSTV